MVHSTIRILQYVPLVGCISSFFYYILCLWGARNFLRQRHPAAHSSTIPNLPPVSILKPLRGTDPDIYESFRSHCLQDYPDYEIVFGVHALDDPVVALVKQLQTEFPDRPIRLVICSDSLGTNGKISSLIQMYAVARHPYILINDSDIRVPHDYLRRVIA